MASSVLIVEDEPVIAADIKSIVIGGGYTVAGVAATFDDAINLYSADLPDFLLVDLQLDDGSSGLDFTNALVPSPAQRSLKAATVSALDAFAALEASSDRAFKPLLGDNQGALASPLSKEEFSALRNDLSSLLSEDEETRPADVESSLTRTQSRISDWVADRLTEIQKGFFTNIGKSLSDWKLYVGLWLVAAGKLEVVIEALRHLHL